MIINTINTIAIVYLFTERIKDKKIFSYSKETTFWNKTLYGISFFFKNKRFFYLPIRNSRKTILKEEIERLLNSSQQQKLQSITAMFSWLKTIKAVEQFEKDYSVVDRKLVEKLVCDFKSKNNI